ncbi:MAG: MBOAT family protein [Oscillospiraceae bacterium]|nr:MBOAT family protein [Oscillospiraceae bacterium]
MTFNSYGFILCFLPIFVIVYFLLGKLHRTAGKAVIIAASAVFYAFAGLNMAALLGASIAINFVMALFIVGKRPQKGPLILAILLNIGLLLYFKYLNFGIETVNFIAQKSIPERQILLPLGISFFTFQQIMYAVSVWKGEIERVRPMDYLAYILYFPKLVMGPLMEPTDFIAQLNDGEKRSVNWDNVASGLKLFSLGLFKKMVLADTFAGTVAWGYANAGTTAQAAATSGDLFLVMLFYTFQIYFDFSGYSDMAVGVSQMINITLPINFNSPYKAVSIRDFWRRWHMSLTSFLTKYIYYPLGGSKKGQVRTCVNIMIVFLVSGIWHGANWTFIVWGCLHGLLQIVERVFKRGVDKLSKVVRWGVSFLSVNLLWLLFGSESVGQWIGMLRTMFRFENMKISEGLLNAFVVPENAFLLDTLHLTQANAQVRGFSMLLYLAAAFAICLIPENNYKRMHRTNGLNMVVCAVAFVWGFLCLSIESQFLYFNF